MLRIEKNTKIFVRCPGKIVSGGPELLHQLVSILNNNGLDAYISYYGKENKIYEIPIEYAQYNVKKIDVIPDNKINIEIIPEGGLHLAHINRNTQKIFWWLSVDYFFREHKYRLQLFDLLKFNKKLWAKQLLRHIIKPNIHIKRNLSIKDIKLMNAINCYQSEYAQNFLQNKDFPNICALKDYLNIEYFNNNNIPTKKNRIIYNPKKGLNFTKKLIKKLPQYEWVAIENMTRGQVIENMKLSKLYIDFGFHPGKDRLPRESALYDCCIITNKLGSARFFEDVMIPENYKFDNKKNNIKDILNKIIFIMNNYEDCKNDFKQYKSMIAREKKEFESQVEFIFDIKINSIG